MELLVKKIWLNLRLIIKTFLIKLKIKTNKTMAITYAYPTVTPELQDLLLGTEIAAQGGEDAPRTRTFTVSSILDLIDPDRYTTAFNNSIAPQSIPAATLTYLTGSNISTNNIKAGTVVTWNISVSKTSAGSASPLFTVRFGTNGTTADATLLTFIAGAQTPILDEGLFTIRCIFRSIGSGTSAILAGDFTLVHDFANGGLSNSNSDYSFLLSSGFNSTTPNSILGITVNSGAAAAWTINQVDVKIENKG